MLKAVLNTCHDYKVLEVLGQWGSTIVQWIKLLLSAWALF